MRLKWRHSFTYRLMLLVLVASLVPTILLVGGSWYLNRQVRQQMERESENALTFAINLEQTLIDSRLTLMRERAMALAGRTEIARVLAEGGKLQPLLDSYHRTLPGADLITVVNRLSAVQGRAGSGEAGTVVQYGGLVQHVLDARTPSASVAVIPLEELLGEPADAIAQARVPVVETTGSSDDRTGTTLGSALALVGAAPVLGPGGEILGAVLVSDILNNDHTIVDEVTDRSPQELPISATIALDGVRVTTSVLALGGGKRAVGTLYSDVVMDEIRAGRDYRGRALVGGWQWQRTIYLPLPDITGKVVAAAFVGIPESAFANLVRSTTISTAAALIAALLALAVTVTIAYRLSLLGIVRPLQRFTSALTGGSLHVRVEADESTETARLADALNDMMERNRQTVGEMARVSRGIKSAGDDLALGARETADNAEAALQVAASALAAAERVGQGTEQASGRLRELVIALARIDVASEEQARALHQASQIVALVTEAVQNSRMGIQGVLDSTRTAVATAQHGRHSALRSLSALDLVQVDAQGVMEAGTASGGDPPEWLQRAERLLADLEEGQKAAAECDDALRQIARNAEQATAKLWELLAAQNEGGARASAVSQQMADLSVVAEETAASIGAMSEASRHRIGEIDGVAGDLEASLALVRRVEAHVTRIAEANHRLRELSERILPLAEQLDEAVRRFPEI